MVRERVVLLMAMIPMIIGTLRGVGGGGRGP